MISMMAMIIIIRSDEGLMLETSALQTFHRGKSTSISARLIKPNFYVMRKWFTGTLMTDLITWSFHIAKRDILATRFI